MIKNQSEFRDAKRKEIAIEERIAAFKKTLGEKGGHSEAKDGIIDDQMNELAELRKQIEWYSKAKEGKTVSNFRPEDLGQYLIALRLSKGLTQQELARVLEVSPAQVSKDELREYRGLSIERAVKILGGLGASISIQVNSGLVESEVVDVVVVDGSGESIAQTASLTTTVEVEPVTVDELQVEEIPAKDTTEAKKVVLKLTVACNNKFLGRGVELRKATEQIEKEVLSQLAAQKLSGNEKMLEYVGNYSVFLADLDKMKYKLPDLITACKAIADKQKCSAKLEFAE